VIAAMRRQAPAGDFRSNLHRGGSAESVKLTLHERRTATSAAAAMGLKVAGVDMLRSDEGPLVIAVNSTPELEAIERASGIDVASAIYRFVEDSLAPRPVAERVEV
jgi:ribosomal protein S6--L-glutamate ligase